MIEEEYLNKIILGDALMVLRSLPLISLTSG